MSKNRIESERSFKDWITTIGGVLGFFTALVAFIIDFEKWIRDQQTLHYISIAGFILYFLGSLWFAFKAKNVKPVWRWTCLVILYVSTIFYFLWVGTWIDVVPTGDWPPDLITYYDFESDADLRGWQEGIQRSDEHAFSGQYALKATQPVQADLETAISLSWQHEFMADVIVGQVYWPDDEKVGIAWAQICVPLGDWDCAGLPGKRGGWNTFVLDLSEMSVGDPARRLSELVLPGLHFQGRLRGATGTSVTDLPMYVDAIQIYRDGVDAPAP